MYHARFTPTIYIYEKGKNQNEKRKISRKFKNMFTFFQV